MSDQPKPEIVISMTGFDLDPDEIRRIIRGVFSANDVEQPDPDSSEGPAAEELRGEIAQIIRDANDSPEALAAWQQHPQLVPADVYAAALVRLIGAYKDETRAAQEHARKAESAIATERRQRLYAEAAERRVEGVLTRQSRPCGGPDAIQMVPVADVRDALHAEDPENPKESRAL